MSKLARIKCPICGTEIADETYEPCPYCQWGYVATEEMLDENEKEPFNLMSLKEAREMYEKGLTIFGDPLPKKKPK